MSKWIRGTFVHTKIIISIMEATIKYVMEKHNAAKIGDNKYALKGWLRPLTFKIQENEVEYQVDWYNKEEEWRGIKQDIEDRYKAEITFLAMRAAFGNARIEESGKKIFVMAER